jgi:hypothetical protein
MSVSARLNSSNVLIDGKRGTELRAESLQCGSCSPGLPLRGFARLLGVQLSCGTNCAYRLLQNEANLHCREGEVLRMIEVRSSVQANDTDNNSGKQPAQE